MRAEAVAVPPLVGEDHICADCGLSYPQLTVVAAVELIQQVPSQVGVTINAVPTDHLRRRPITGAWSIAEYTCHLRDVYMTSTIRLHRARTEDRPAVEPMLNDLRARRFRYNDADIDAVLTELDAAVRGFVDEVHRLNPIDWDRVLTRRPDEQRTSRWLVRQAAHEGRHHLGDIYRLSWAISD
jgi:hypothetical protein